jgi:transposase
MPQSSTLSVGWDVHQASIAGASVAKAHDADAFSLGPIGTRQADMAQLVRTRPSTATHLVCVYEAGPWGSWRSRDLTKQGHHGWVVAPSLMPQKAGNRVNTDRRDAIPLARVRRAGDLPPVDVPAGEDAARRDLSRAREDAIADLKAATWRLNAFVLRHDSR